MKLKDVSLVRNAGRPHAGTPERVEPRPRSVERDTAVRVGIIVISMIVTTLWISRDKVPPSWDQSYYLTVTLRLLNSLHAGGLNGLLHGLLSTDSGRGPLLPTLMLPLYLLFHVGQKVGLLLNIAIWPVLLVSVDTVATRLFSRRAGLLAMAIAATMPLLVGLSHEVFVDFLLSALAITTVALLLVSDNFTRTGPAALLGITIGLGILTKITFPAFVLGPLVLLVAQTIRLAVAEIRHDGPRRQGRKRVANLRVVNLVIAGILSLTLAGIWYVPNLQAALNYVKGSTAPGVFGPKNPGTIRNIATFTLSLVNQHLSWVFLLAAAVAAMAVSAFLVRLGRRSPADLRARAPRDAYRAIFLLSWIALPFWSVATSHDQDPRLIAPAFVAFAVLLAGLIDTVPWDRIRRYLTTFVVAGGVLQTGIVIFAVTLPLVPHQVRIKTPVGPAVLNLDDSVMGYNRPAGGRDNATPVLTYLEALSRGPGATMRPINIGVLQFDPQINTTTLTFLAAANHDPFGFHIEPDYGGDRSTLAAALGRENVVLYMKPWGYNLMDTSQPGFATAGTPLDPIYVSNLHTASQVVTPALLAPFANVKTFSMGDGRTLLVAARQPL